MKFNFTAEISGVIIADSAKEAKDQVSKAEDSFEQHLFWLAKLDDEEDIDSDITIDEYIPDEEDDDETA
jgi:hypothetical protein